MSSDELYEELLTLQAELSTLETDSLSYAETFELILDVEEEYLNAIDEESGDMDGLIGGCDFDF